mmetsp:Transcript_14016/g.30247  ORF Transcript_14016/g.30247 Transcript_14016/m.30247 type:complete len:250 (+) Transcript_14016:306-1055(+)
MILHSVGIEATLSYKPAPAQCSRSSPLLSDRAKYTALPPSDAGLACARSLLGIASVCTWSTLVLFATKQNARPGSFPTKASPSPTHTSPSTSSLLPVSGFTECRTNAKSAGTSCMRSTDMRKSPSATPHARRDKTALSVHLDAHTVQIACQRASISATSPVPPNNGTALRSSSACSGSGQTSWSATTERAFASASRRVSAPAAASTLLKAARSASADSGSFSRTRSKQPNGSDNERGTSTSRESACFAN